MKDYAYLVLGTRCVIRVNELYRDVKEAQRIVVNSGELKLSDGRSESGARGEIPPCREAEACKAGLRGVRVPNRHLG